jgi:hypothetical protein
MLLVFLGEEGLKNLSQELDALSKEEQQEILDGLASIETMNEIATAMDSIVIPQNPTEWQAARDVLAKLPENECKETERRGVFFWYFFFSSFFNTLSLMVHGAKMTSLVPRK